MSNTVPPLLAALLFASMSAGNGVAQIRAQTAPADGVKNPPVKPVVEAIALPTEMIAVPAGTVTLGCDPKTLIDVVSHSALADESRLKEIKLLYSELGSQRVDIAAFFLAKFPVTNAQYKAFVERTGHRYPFHWWFEGRADDRLARIEEISKEFPNATGEQKFQEYWSKHWKELPFAIPKYSDAPGDDCPVVYVDWRDANAYATWLGMRLSTEAEWDFAASGGQPIQYLWGDDPKQCPIQRGTKFDKMWPVGHFGSQTEGKFGHGDMVLGVREWTGELGFQAFDFKSFQSSLDQLFKDKLFKGKDSTSLQDAKAYRPKWAGDKVVLKGGMFGSTGVDMRIWTRAYAEHFQTTSAVGFRLAKSPEPGRDFIGSWLKLDYDYSYFGGTRKPDIKNQTGIEKYELVDNGKTAQGYHAISIAPVSYASDEKTTTLDRLFAPTVDDNIPLVVATIATSEKLAVPEVGPGIYTLCLRDAGLPRELPKALAEAHKAIKAAKVKAKGAEFKPDDVSGDWEGTLKKFGITKAEALDGHVDFVRVGKVKVPAAEHSWILRDAAGEPVATWPAKGRPELKSKYEEGSTVKLNERDSKQLDFEFGVPTDVDARGKAYLFKCSVKLAESEIDASWRFPGK